MTTSERANLLVSAHRVIAAWQSGTRTPELGREADRLTRLHEAGTVAFSADTYTGLSEARIDCMRVLIRQVDDLLNVLLDDAGLPAVDVEQTDSVDADADEEEDGWEPWACAICALAEDTENTISAYADLFSDSPEAIADHLFSQLKA